MPEMTAKKVLRNQAHAFFAWGCFRHFLFRIEFQTYNPTTRPFF
jgi:hypothetical protein